MGATNSGRYLLTLAAMAGAGLALVGGAVATIDPFGLVPIAPTIPGINTTKVTRNTSDRLIKRYDAVAMRPKTVIIGTSRVKQAFDPDKLGGVFAPAYNAGIDALMITEARQLLEGYVRDGVPIEHVFFELFLFQFFKSWPGNQRPIPIAGNGAIGDAFTTTLSTDAVRAAIETIVASRTAEIIVTRRNGFRPTAWPHNGAGFVPPQWLASSRKPVKPIVPVKSAKSEEPSTLLQDQSFVELARIVEICSANNIDLRLFVGPLHPVFAYTQGKALLHEWLTRISAMPRVISFVSAQEFRDYELARPKRYYADYSHVSFDAAELIIDDLMAYPKLQRGRALDPVTLPAILAEWDDQLAAWGDLNPDFVEGFAAEFPARTDLPHRQPDH